MVYLCNFTQTGSSVKTRYYYDVYHEGVRATLNSKKKKWSPYSVAFIREKKSHLTIFAARRNYFILLKMFFKIYYPTKRVT